MVKNVKLIQENNERKIVENPETLAAVYTGYCLLVNKININRVENINRGRTMLILCNIGLPLYAFVKRMFMSRFNWKRERAGPVTNIEKVLKYSENI